MHAVDGAGGLQHVHLGGQLAGEVQHGVRLPHQHALRRAGVDAHGQQQLLLARAQREGVGS